VKKIVVVTPVFNDWESFRMLAQDLSGMASKHNLEIRIIAVDDGSSVPDSPAPINAEHLHGIEVLKLVCNLGHQRAIAIGLVEASKSADCDAVIVMDSDGEDRVEDIPTLIEQAKANAGKVVVATRASRTEGFGFRSFYKIYKALFRMLVGTWINFGNFALIPFHMLPPLTHSAGIWNHLAASICRSRLPLQRHPCPRGHRYAGQSQMNFTSLLTHGFGAMSVFIDVILVRIIASMSFFMALLLAAIFVIFVIKFATDMAIPGWATSAIGLLSVLLLQSFILIFTSVFMVLNLRTIKTVIPQVEGPQFIQKRITLTRTKA
jgi:cellulose synthase/poly-beta-1,6-N-acetylglucosamine synthase-like glycosyltransferase